MPARIITEDGVREVGPPKPPPEEPPEILDEEWLLNRSVEELQGFCEELGVSEEGTHEELAARIVNTLEDQEEAEGHTGEEEGEEEAEEESEEEESEEEEDEDRGRMVSSLRDQSRFQDDEEDTTEKLERLRAERAAGQREEGSIRNEEVRNSLSAEDRIKTAIAFKEEANALFSSGSNAVSRTLLASTTRPPSMLTGRDHALHLRVSHPHHCSGEACPRPHPRPTRWRCQPTWRPSGS